jgi:CYTH domain-containing protein
MRQEIERKFLVTDDGWRAAAGRGEICCQGYITAGPASATVRVRLLGERGYLTIKGPVRGISRPEMEYGIPAADAEFMIENLCGDRLVSKKRYTLELGGMTWEIDEFSGLNQGLIVAEIELESEGQPFEKPAWLGAEVTFDPRYTNAALAGRPFTRW